MNSFYNKNGLVFWSEHEIRTREFFRDYFAQQLHVALISTNPAWKMLMIEAPLLTPPEFINKNYTEKDMYICDDLVLRPETTPGSYHWLASMLGDKNSGIKIPVCVWQYGKSFRKEQDQVIKNMRLKEFYQQEFQCVFTSDSANDYHSVIQKPVEKMIKDMIGLPTRIVDSDRLPDYSLKTVDIEVNNEDKWMEVCSISLRKDFPITVKYSSKDNKVVEKSLLVLEVAIGLDRSIYNFMKRTEK